MRLVNNRQRGSITLIEFTVVSSVGLVFILAVVGFKSTFTTNASKDYCIASQTTTGVDLANPDLDPSKLCKAYEDKNGNGGLSGVSGSTGSTGSSGSGKSGTGTGPGFLGAGDE